MARCVTFAVARIRVGNRRNLAYFSLWHPKYGRQGIQKAYTGPRTKFGCDWSIVVGCRSRNDRRTSRQNGMTIGLTLYERDAIIITNAHAQLASDLVWQNKHRRLHLSIRRGKTIITASCFKSTSPSTAIFTIFTTQSANWNTHKKLTGDALPVGIMYL